MNRKKIILKHVKLADSNLLEIGALDSPTFTKKEANIKYVDYETKEALHLNNKSNPRYALEKIVDVDYVCSEPIYSNVINEDFNLIIANHVIEHIPDTISWLQEMTKILTPNGKIFLSVPDKNYTFDFVREETKLFEIISNHHEKVSKPTFKHILEHLYNFKNINAKDIWQNQHKSALNDKRFPLKEAIRIAEINSKKEYIDVHCHVFTFASLYKILLELIELDYLNLKILDFKQVIFMKNEFHLMLQKA